MSGKTKIWLIVAVALVLIGCAIFAGAMSMLRWDFKGLATHEYETNEYTIDEYYSNIRILADTADVVLVPAESGKTRVVCYERENAKHSVAVKDGALVIELHETRDWHDYIGINFGSPKITVYLPAGEYGALSVKLSTGDVTVPGDFKFESVAVSATTGDVSNAASATGATIIRTSTGHIRVQDVSVGALELSATTGRVMVSRVSCEGDMSLTVSTGKTYVTGVTCQSFTSVGDTGDITMENVIVAGNLSIERSTGEVELERCDAASLRIVTDTGDVEGTLLSDKVFVVTTDTGEVEVPRTTSGGVCEVTTSTGDIEFEIK